MATYTFAQLPSAIAKYQKRMEATFRGSAQDVARAIVLPRSKGGNMRVLTGFLRASLMASTSQMPSINPSARPPDDVDSERYPEDLSQINLVIAGADLGQSVFLGFTASYARYREYEDGFVRLAAQRWSETVKDNARKAMVAFP